MEFLVPRTLSKRFTVLYFFPSGSTVGLFTPKRFSEVAFLSDVCYNDTAKESKRLHDTVTMDYSTGLKII